MNVVNKREVYVDVISGIMISWMILGHCLYFSHHHLLFYQFLSFYMPWFFYKSGMLFSIKNPKLLLRKDANKLLRSFIVYSLIGWLVWCILGMIGGSQTIVSCLWIPIKTFCLKGCIAGNGALWFLLTLFFVRQLSNVLINSKLLPPPIWALILFGMAFALYAIRWYNYCWWFGNIFSGLCFFLLGYWLKDKEKNQIVFILSTIFFVLVVCAYCFGWIGDFPYLYMHANLMYSGNYLLFYPTALAGIIMTNNIFRILCKYIKFRILEYIGKNSMTFYTTHMILFVVVSYVAKHLMKIEDSIVLFIIFLGSAVVFLPLINESIKFFKNKNISKVKQI